MPNPAHLPHGALTPARSASASEVEQASVEPVLTAIVVTDLEGFTPLVRRLGDLRAQRVIHAHNGILRECLQDRQGTEVAHTGDGIMAAFRSVARALDYAVELQRRLTDYNRSHAGTPLRVRVGVHVGEPLPEEGRLFGSCIITAVRICAAASPQHVLVSDVVRALAGGPAFQFLDLGPCPLKGYDEPARLHELRWWVVGSACEPRGSAGTAGWK